MTTPISSSSVTIRLPKELKESLEAYCEKEYIPLSQLLRQILREFAATHLPEQKGE